jgi:hypothetical protein
MGGSSSKEPYKIVPISVFISDASFCFIISKKLSKAVLGQYCHK